MAEFEDVQHTGGAITIRRAGSQYQLSFVHMRPVRSALVELFVKADGTPLEFSPITGMSLRDDEQQPVFMVMLASDAEGLFGQQCPKCNSYFRSAVPFSSRCPYCGSTAEAVEFITPNQRRFFKAFAESILTAPEGDTTVDLDQLLDNIPENKESPWRYTEERQQTHFKCAQCGRSFDVLGEYVECPMCGKCTHDVLIERKLAARNAEFEAARATLTDRHERENRWQQLLLGCVSDFEGFANDLRDRLLRLPATPSRKRALSSLSFQSIANAADRLREWFAFDVLDAIGTEDREFLNIMFNRRHLFVHRAGRVDQEYIDNSEDTTAKLNQVLRLKSTQIARLIPLLESATRNFIRGFESIE